MATVKAHYDEVLSDVYSWMFGGFGNGIERNVNFFKTHRIIPAHSGVAIDLGAGCGFQSIPLAEAGFSVTAIDMDGKLLNELANHSRELAVNIVQDDLNNFNKYTNGRVELIVCMTDTLLHLESKAQILSLFDNVFASLEKEGRFIITFRDLTSDLSDLERFIPVGSDDDIIFTCFLEYEPETVKVHDIVYKREKGKWCLHKSYYRKLRVSGAWVDEQLCRVGFTCVESAVDNGLITIIATK